MSKIITHDNSALLQPYTLRQNKFTEPARSLFFLSFADAFRAMAKGRDFGTVLVPDFYCPDTLNVFAKFGKLAFYRINPDLTVDVESYLEVFNAAHPGLVVNYAFVGFPSSDDRIKKLLTDSPATTVIEDCAHRLLTGDKIAFFHKNHYYIDSIRKQTGILGSHIVFSAQAESPLTGRSLSWYGMKCALARAQQELCVLGSILLNSQRLFELSEICFERLDALIGTSDLPATGGRLSNFFWRHLDLGKIKAHKAELSNAYLAGLQGSPGLTLPKVLIAEDLTYFPIVVPQKICEQLVDFLTEQEVWVSTLWDAPDIPITGLNKTLLQSVIVLPLTWTTTLSDVSFVCRNIGQFFKERTA